VDGMRKPNWMRRAATAGLAAFAVLGLGPVATGAAGPASVQPAALVTAAPSVAVPARARPAVGLTRAQSTWSHDGIPTTTTPSTVAPAAPAPEAAPAPDANASPEERGAAALARISYPWQQTGYTISFYGPRPGLYGRTGNGIRRIEIFVRPDESADLLAHVVAHEIGHAVDLTFNNAARRSQWLAIRGLDPSASWFTCSGCHDFDTPAGDFAETFAYWQTGPAIFRSVMAPPPSPAMLDQLRPLFFG